MNSNDGITSSSTKEANAKLPSNHPKVEGTGGECPYKNPVKSISSYFGRKKEADVSKETSSLKSEESPSPSSSPSSMHHHRHAQLNPIPRRCNTTFILNQ
jgi:hypothetical protein